MNTTTQKYVRLKEYDSFIFFPQTMAHSTFKYLNPVSAGFCRFWSDGTLKCFGESFSLGITSDQEDTKLATKQVYGFDAMLDMMN